ncbi:c-type cytochrome [Castellaniella sp.]|uniref:c-type cytochrome n=1 Tax=Castellaniella sp. TaxID=1955812 RepID=UPI002AFDF033|nr:cytochrome c [Castellaniella sp.]
MKALTRTILVLIALAVLAIAAMIWVPVQRTPRKAPGDTDPTISVARGEYVMRASDCMACHTAKDGKPFAGGLQVESPLGVIYSTNITPDKETGIGDYTLEDFRAALYDGLRKDGTHLYPAMPYENFRFLTEADVASLYQYFMKQVPAVRNEVPETDLEFPFNQRWGLRAWNWLALKDPEFKPVSDDTRINRGAYLVQGPAHCAACHSPRTAFMTQDGLTDKDAAFLTGGELNGWSVPDLRGKDSVSARWSAGQMAHYLATGRNDQAASVGEMSLVVAHSLQYLTDDDNMAIAAYLKHLSGGSDAGAAPAASGSVAPTETQRLLTSADPKMPLGARLYLDNCAGCHFVNGRGAPEIFPALDGNALVNATSPVGLISVILHGAELPSTEKRPERLRMQGYAWRLNDEEVAALATFVRQGWNNHATEVGASAVAPLRAADKP